MLGLVCACTSLPNECPVVAFVLALRCLKRPSILFQGLRAIESPAIRSIGLLPWIHSAGDYECLICGQNAVLLQCNRLPPFSPPLHSPSIFPRSRSLKLSGQCTSSLGADENPFSSGIRPPFLSPPFLLSLPRSIVPVFLPISSFPMVWCPSPLPLCFCAGMSFCPHFQLSFSFSSATACVLSQILFLFNLCFSPLLHLCSPCNGLIPVGRAEFPLFLLQFLCFSNLNRSLLDIFSRRFQPSYSILLSLRYALFRSRPADPPIPYRLPPRRLQTPQPRFFFSSPPITAWAISSLMVCRCPRLNLPEPFCPPCCFIVFYFYSYRLPSRLYFSCTGSRAGPGYWHAVYLAEIDTPSFVHSLLSSLPFSMPSSSPLPIVDAVLLPLFVFRLLHCA